MANLLSVSAEMTGYSCSPLTEEGDRRAMISAGGEIQQAFLGVELFGKVKMAILSRMIVNLSFPCCFLWGFPEHINKHDSIQQPWLCLFANFILCDSPNLKVQHSKHLNTILNSKRSLSDVIVQLGYYS